MSILSGLRTGQQDNQVDWDGIKQQLLNAAHAGLVHLIRQHDGREIQTCPEVKGYRIWITYTPLVTMSVYMSRVGSDSFIFSIESVNEQPAVFTWRGDQAWAAEHGAEIVAALKEAMQ